MGTLSGEVEGIVCQVEWVLYQEGAWVLCQVRWRGWFVKWSGYFVRRDHGYFVR